MSVTAILFMPACWFCLFRMCMQLNVSYCFVEMDHPHVQARMHLHMAAGLISHTSVGLRGAAVWIERLQSMCWVLSIDMIRQ
jgi:hypothetical protein